jgi:hypothetical protein
MTNITFTNWKLTLILATRFHISEAPRKGIPSTRGFSTCIEKLKPLWNVFPGQRRGSRGTTHEIRRG